MLRDRLPSTVDLALRWTQSKNKWIDHVYAHFIGIFKSKEDRNSTTRVILGLSSRSRNFDFHKTIDWDCLDTSEKEEWKRVEGWVNWFQSNMVEIDNTIEVTNITYGDKHQEISKLSIFNNCDPNWKNELIDFILKNK